MARKKSGKLTFSLENYVDVDSLSSRDKETVQMLLKVPRFFREQVKMWSESRFHSVTDMMQTAAWNMMTGMDYTTDARDELIRTVKEETQNYYDTLITTLKGFQENIEKVAEPVLKVAEDVEAFKDNIRQQARSEALEVMKKQKEHAKLDVLRTLHFFPSQSTSEIISRVSATSELPPLLIHEVVQEMVDEELVEPYENSLRILPPKNHKNR